MKIRKIIIISVLIIIILAPFFLYRYYMYSGPVPENCPPDEVYRLDLFYFQIDTYLKRFHSGQHDFNPKDIRGHFSITPNKETDLYGSSDMAYILWILDEIDERTTPEGRAEWAAVIQRFQNPQTGRFDRGNLSGESTTHATAFATGALVLLGSRPRYPHRWAESIFNSPESIERWLDSFYWHEVWSGSHEAGAAAALLDAPQGVSVPPAWKEWVLQAFSKRVDERTGFWKEGIADCILRDATTIDLGGAAHFWWIYMRLKQPIPYPEKVIDNILSLQKESGIWGTRLFNGALPQGIDFDAINGLRLAYRALPPEIREQKRERIVAALNRYACIAHYHLNAPGSVNRLFTKTHKMVGTLNALAELNLFYEELTGRQKIITPRQWRSVMSKITWQ
jgi:hypothetical protein